MPMRDTMQGCCRACSMLASCRNSEKFLMASVARRCLSMVSAGRARPSVLPRVGAPPGSESPLGDSWGWPGPGLVFPGAAVSSPRIGRQMGALLRHLGWYQAPSSGSILIRCYTWYSGSSDEGPHTPTLITHSLPSPQPAVHCLRLSATSHSKPADLSVTQSLAGNQAPSTDLQGCWSLLPTLPLPGARTMEGRADYCPLVDQKENHRVVMGL